MLNHVNINQIMLFSVKSGIVRIEGKHTADTPNFIIINYFEFEVALITPGGVPGVFEEHVLQASGFVSAVTDSEYAVVNCVKNLVVIKYLVSAIASIDDAA